MIRTTFFNFCRKSSIFQVSVVLASEILIIRLIFYLVLFSDTFIQDKRFLYIRITYQTMCRSFKKVVFVRKTMMPLINASSGRTKKIGLGHFKISFLRENKAVKHDLVEFKVQCLKVFCCQVNKSTILLSN